MLLLLLSISKIKKIRNSGKICIREAKQMVRCAVGTTGLHQRSALSLFLFAVIMDRLTNEVRREPPWMMLFADDIVICRDQGRSGAET